MPKALHLIATKEEWLEPKCGANILVIKFLVKCVLLYFLQRKRRRALRIMTKPNDSDKRYYRSRVIDEECFTLSQPKKKRNDKCDYDG